MDFAGPRRGESQIWQFCEHGHMCEIWGSHGCVAGDVIRLECEAELLGE
jgi:hypothetical protein